MSNCGHGPNYRITGTDQCAGCIYGFPVELTFAGESAGTVIGPSIYGTLVCPECKGAGDFGGGCNTCDPLPPERKADPEALVALIKRVRERHETHDPEGVDRNLATVLLLHYNITPKGR